MLTKIFEIPMEQKINRDKSASPEDKSNFAIKFFDGAI